MTTNRHPDPSNDARETAYPVEQRFSRAQFGEIRSTAGLVDLLFSSRDPYWWVVGFKADN